MNKDWRLYAKHIVEAIEKTWDYHSRLKSGLADADIATDAILRNLETIAEAASDKLPDVIKDKYPDIEWQAIAGLRVRLAHVYLSIDQQVIDQTIEHDLHGLHKAMKAEVSD